MGRQERSESFGHRDPKIHNLTRAPYSAARATLTATLRECRVDVLDAAARSASQGWLCVNCTCSQEAWHRRMKGAAPPHVRVLCTVEGTQLLLLCLCFIWRWTHAERPMGVTMRPTDSIENLPQSIVATMLTFWWNLQFPAESGHRYYEQAVTALKYCAISLDIRHKS